MNIFTNSFKSIASGALDTLFDSLARNIIIYKTPQQVIISEGSGYNFAFGNSDPNIQTQTVVASGIFPAKIRYDAEQARIYGNIRAQDSEESLREMLLKGRVKITVRPDAFAFLQDCKEVIIDGKTVRVKSDYRPHFPFGGATQFYNYFLESVQ